MERAANVRLERNINSSRLPRSGTCRAGEEHCNTRGETSQHNNNRDFHLDSEEICVRYQKGLNCTCEGRDENLSIKLYPKYMYLILCKL